MIELYLSKNNNHSSEAYGKYYPRVSYKETLDIHLMAKHMAEHNTPFSEGTIEGILRDFVKCTREQTLMGNTVKVDDLAIFKVSVIGNGCAKLYDKESDKTISASLGSRDRGDRSLIFQNDQSPAPCNPPIILDVFAFLQLDNSQELLA